MQKCTKKIKRNLTGQDSVYSKTSNWKLLDFCILLLLFVISHVVYNNQMLANHYLNTVVIIKWKVITKPVMTVKIF